MCAILVLSRHKDESVIADTDQGRITITVVEVKNGNTVRLGIDAPADIPVHRLEVANAIDRDRTNGMNLPHKGRRHAFAPADHAHRFSPFAIGPGELCVACKATICGRTLEGTEHADLCMLTHGHIGECINPYQNADALGLDCGVPFTDPVVHPDLTKPEARHGIPGD